MNIPDDTAFVQRSVLASAAGLHHADAMRQLADLFTPGEFVAWREMRTTRSDVKVVFGRDSTSRTTTWAIMTPPGITVTVEGSFNDVIDELTREVRAWASDEARSGAGLARSIRALTDEQLHDYVLVRATTTPVPGMTFQIVPFHDDQGAVTERAVPFTDGRPPQEISIPGTDGSLRKYKGEYVSGARLRYVRA
ncbi:hypothetical protein A0130_02485 [Leifsonia xyli]|uniref:hypothetical protein n=1 Tax=Leifsonia xyli TaxID=1575 RepID=UPI0007CDDCF5|nr:hypothetical protein A0130_02485 [Leifsonia xyli]